MKKTDFKLILFVLLIVVGYTTLSFKTNEQNIQNDTEYVDFGNEFCEGWRNGFSAGFCHNKGIGCLPPPPPICPPPNPLNNEYYDCYQCGYNRGFAAGLRDVRR